MRQSGGRARDPAGGPAGRNRQPLVDNRLFVLVLQHPQERSEPRATAAVTVAALRRARLVVGLSWPNLARALGGRPAARPIRGAGACSISARRGRIRCRRDPDAATPAGRPDARRDHCAGPRRQAVARHRPGAARPRGHRAARRHLEPGEDAVVAQSMAVEAAAARAEPDRPGTVRPAAPRTAA